MGCFKAYHFKFEIFVECLDGFYNKQCSGVCGSCLLGNICDKIDGHCANGCSTNYQEPLCQGIF